MTISKPKSANDNGPLNAAQVRALKIAIAVMTLLIFGALLAIVYRLISHKPSKPVMPVATLTAPAASQTLLLPQNAVVKSLHLNANRLIVHYKAAAGEGAIIQDLATGKPLTQIKFLPKTSAPN